jgi:hypothetical protein
VVTVDVGLDGARENFMVDGKGIVDEANIAGVAGAGNRDGHGQPLK